MSALFEKLPAPARKYAPLLTAALCLLLIFAVVFGWRVWRQSASAMHYAPPPVEVAAQTITAQTLPQSLEASGALQAVREVVLAPEIAGRIITIRFESGAQVKQGTPLVQLFDAPERADLAAAKARAQFARLQYKRSKDLAPSGAEPRQTLQQREAELAQAEAASQQIEARLAQKLVHAPFTGVIGLRRVNPGQYVNAGDALATLTALDQLYANFTVPQQDLAKLSVGSLVTIRTDAYPGQSFPAKINAIEPMVGADTRNISVQAILDNPEHRLRPGLYVTASISQPAQPRALLIPATAIQTSASGDSVLVIKAGKAELVPVITGQRMGENIVVEKGLKDGDVIITNGQLRVQPGGAVTIAAPKQ